MSIRSYLTVNLFLIALFHTCYLLCFAQSGTQASSCSKCLLFTSADQAYRAGTRSFSVTWIVVRLFISIYLSIYLSQLLSTSYLCQFASINLSIYQYIYVSLHLSIYLSISVCFDISKNIQRDIKKTTWRKDNPVNIWLTLTPYLYIYRESER